MSFSDTELAVAANAARTRHQGTEQWADLLRTTIPQGLVRDAILASPAWPDIAAAMGRLNDQGVDVARILADAHAADQAVTAATNAPNAPGPRRTTDASRCAASGRTGNRGYAVDHRRCAAPGRRTVPGRTGGRRCAAVAPDGCPRRCAGRARVPRPAPPTGITPPAHAPAPPAVAPAAGEPAAGSWTPAGADIRACGVR
ncbi:hypothetical protein ACFYT5_37910 [Streptomyces anulatus]|uniref:hypothetical protein n=1 Tax=Streptomyces anulatus TaxID=1892 RepID=UPI0036C180CA